MIPFPFSLFYILNEVSGFQPFTGFYDSYELYQQGTLNIFTSGVALESGKKVYTTGKFGFFTGKTFLSENLLADDFQFYTDNTRVFTYPSGSGYFLGTFLFNTGVSFYTNTYLSDTFETYSSGFSSVYPNATYSGKGYWDKVDTGHSYAGYIRPLSIGTPISIKNLTSIGPAYFTGSGVLITGDWDTISDTKVGYLNRSSGLYFFDHMFRLEKGSVTLANFTTEIALRRSGWAVDSARPFDNNAASGTLLARNAGTNNLRAGVSGSFDNSTATLSDNRWTYVSFVRSGTEGRFYFNGILSNTVVIAAGNPTNSIPFYLGRRGTNIPEDLQYRGYIDEFRFWNYARTSGQIYSGFSGTVDPNSAGLQYYLSLGY
jgi:hypothetical protein